MSDIKTGPLRLISQEAFDWLERAYPAPVIEATTSPEAIKWAAAQYEVVNQLKAWAGKTQTVGAVSVEPGRTHPTGAVVRYGA